jgi:hypothetical protein
VGSPGPVAAQRDHLGGFKWRDRQWLQGQNTSFEHLQVISGMTARGCRAKMAQTELEVCSVVTASGSRDMTAQAKLQRELR